MSALRVVKSLVNVLSTAEKRKAQLRVFELRYPQAMMYSVYGMTPWGEKCIHMYFGLSQFY